MQTKITGHGKKITGHEIDYGKHQTRWFIYLFVLAGIHLKIAVFNMFKIIEKNRGKMKKWKTVTQVYQ